MKRDSQRSKVYACDDALMEKTHRRETVAEMQIIVDAMLGQLDGIVDTCYLTPIKVKDGRARRRPCGGFGSISMPKFCRYDLMLAHEVAHCIQINMYGKRTAWHGPEFCTLYLLLVKRGISVDMARQLAVEFRKRGVDYIV